MLGRQTGQRKKIPQANYYQGGGVNRSNDPFKRRTKRNNNAVAKTIDVFIFIAVLAGLAYSLLVSPNPNVIASTTVYRPASTYRDGARESLGTIKDRTKISFDEQSTISSLQKQFPEISSASIELPLFSQRPTIRLQISRPAYTISGAGGVFVIDNDGVAVDRADKFPAVKGLLTIQDQSGYKISEGNKVLSGDNVSFINTVVAQAKHSNVPVAGFILPPAAQELDLKTADKSYLVKFYLGGDPLVQTGQWLAARHQFGSGQQPASYLDVRVAGKIYYK